MVNNSRIYGKNKTKKVYIKQEMEWKKCVFE